MVWLLGLVLVVPVAGEEPAGRLAIQDVRVLTMDGQVVERGTVLVRGPRIEAVGADVEVPEGTAVTAWEGATIMPGLIDPFSSWGATGPGGGSASASRRAEDAWDRYDTADLQEVLRHGVTAVYVSPPGPSGLCGTGAVIRLVPEGRDAIGRLLRRHSALCIDLGGTDKPVTRLKTLVAVRKQFRDAVAYRRRWEDYEEDLAEYTKQLQEDAAKGKKEGGTEGRPGRSAPSAAEGGEQKEEEAKGEEEKEGEGPKKPQRPARSDRFEVILRALDGRTPVRVRAYRSADILNALELAEEFGVSVILEGAIEAHLVAGRLAEAGVPVVLGRMDFRAGARDDFFRRAVEDLGGLLDRTGVAWTVGSGRGAPGRSRFVALNAQLAARRLGDDRALRLVTADAADLLGVADRIGRLRPGLLADFVIWSGDPLDPTSRVEAVYVGGVPVYRAEAGTGDD